MNSELIVHSAFPQAPSLTPQASRLKPHAFLFLVLVAVLILAACGPAVPVSWHGKELRFGGAAYPDGKWKASLRGLETISKPGDEIRWTIDYSMTGRGLDGIASRIQEIRVVVAALRINDAQGHYRDPDALFTSTYLTPSGLPIEGFQYLIPNSKIGGPYKTPLDIAQKVPLDRIEFRRRSLRFSTTIHHRLDEDFPPGLYRFELAFYASIEGKWMKLPMVRGVDGTIAGCDLDFEKLYYSKIWLPPVRIGRIDPPRMIWTLFTSSPNYGVSGVVAEEDAPHFAMTNRVKIQTRYTLPCKPDREKCVYRIEPELPTVHRSLLFLTKEFPYRAIEPKYSTGEVRVSVLRPDGKRDDLGTHAFRVSGLFGPKTLSGDLDYVFDLFGRYEITMTGFMLDRFGNRFEAGGRYVVWVAYPLTFSTGMKPGTPGRVGRTYSPAAMINPPLPAQVTATLSFYPATHPEDVEKTIYRGTAQRFGYFFPDPAEEIMRFSEPGEYLFDIFATYTDEEGRVYMGHQKNASVVLPEEPNMIVKGFPVSRGSSLNKSVSLALDGAPTENLGNLFFPARSGEMIYFPGNAPLSQAIQPAMSVEEPTGYLEGLLKKNFPPRLVSLSSAEKEEDVFSDNSIIFPGCQENFRIYARDEGRGKNLPLLSTTDAGYSPYAFPERVNRRGYFYIATSRPGFPVFFTVADSTIAENYWNTGTGSYKGSVGAARRGDQPGDVYWSVVSGLFSDPAAGRSFFGQYASGGVALPRGDPVNYSNRPFTRPVANILGVDVYLYGGAGPSPGSIFETGAVKSVGAMTVPAVAYDARIEIIAPSGEKHLCLGRADEIGLFACPAGEMHFDEPGVYQVFTHFQEGPYQGSVAGSRGGWYKVYCVDKDTRHRLIFDEMPSQISYEEILVISGRVTPPLKGGRIHYSIVTPGMLMDEGALELNNGRFRFTFRPDQFGAQFPNLKDHPQPFASPRKTREMIRGGIRGLVKGFLERTLADTVEIAVFAEGRDEEGNLVTAGGKFALRGGRVMMPEAFRANGSAP